MALVSSKLFGGRDDGQIFTVSNKNSAFTRSNINLTIVSIIDVNVGSDVKNKILRISAILDVILLAFNRIDFLYSELIRFILKPIIIWIILFLHCFWF